MNINPLDCRGKRVNCVLYDVLLLTWWCSSASLRLLLQDRSTVEDSIKTGHREIVREGVKEIGLAQSAEISRWPLKHTLPKYSNDLVYGIGSFGSCLIPHGVTAPKTVILIPEPGISSAPCSFMYYSHRVFWRRNPPATPSGKYKVVQIWPGQSVTCLHTNSPGHIWTTLYMKYQPKTICGVDTCCTATWHSRSLR
jgi:hypothetical protein